MSLKLYDHPGNTNSRKIRAVALELDAPLATVPVDMAGGEHKRPEFLRRNPNGKVPTLADGDLCIWESNAILCYVAAKYGKGKLLPTEPKARAEVDQWLFWQTAHLQAALGKIMWERVYKARMNLGEADPKQVQAGLDEFDRYAAVLDGALTGKEFICGALTIADFALVGTFASRAVAHLDVTKFPNIVTWLQRVESRPSWVAAER